MAQKGEDRRRHCRFQCNGEAEIRSLSTGLRAVGKIENLSLGGCRIMFGAGHRFREAEHVEMTFCVRQLPMRVQASVCQLHAGKAIGVAFTLLTERGKLQLLALIEELAEVLHDQARTLIQYPASLADFPSDCRNGHRSAGPDDKETTRSAGRPEPIDRDPR